MGVDLQMLPLMSKDYWAAGEIIRIEQDYDLFELIETLSPLPIPKGSMRGHLSSGGRGDTCYGEMTTDPYGRPLTFVLAGHLKSLRDRAEVQTSWKNRAVWNLISEYPDDWPFVLYWC